MPDLLWTGLAALALLMGSVGEATAGPAHLDHEIRSAIIELNRELDSEVVVVELIEVVNPEKSLFYVIVEQPCEENLWLEIARLSPFPLDQRGRFVTRLLRLEDGSLPVQLRVRIASDEGRDLSELTSITVDVRPEKE